MMLQRGRRRPEWRGAKRENQCRRDEDAKGPDCKVDILGLIGPGPQGIKTRSCRIVPSATGLGPTAPGAELQLTPG